MKKRLASGFLALCMVLLAACSGGGGGDGSAAGGNQVQIKFTTYLPEPHDITQLVLKPFIEDMAKVTDGRVTATLYAGAALGANDAQFDLVTSGAADMGLSAHGYNPGRFPLTGVVELPFISGSAKERSADLWQLYQKFKADFDKEHEGVIVLGLYKNDPYMFLLRDKKVQSLEDLKGLKIRSPSQGGNQILEALGATPVSMPMPEVYEAMQRGVIDGALAPISVLFDYKLSDVTKHVTAGDFMSITHYIVANKNSWAKISSQDQAAIEQLVGEKISVWSGEVYDGAAQKGWDKAKENNIEVTYLSDAELAKFKAALEPIADKYLSDLESKGLPARAVYEEALRLMAQ